MPAGPGIRVDTAVVEGDRIPPEYDNLIAKVMAEAPTRESAIDRLRRGLDEIEIGGIQTTLPFDRFVVRDPTFRAGDVSTTWVAERWDGPADRARARKVALLVAALAHATRIPHPEGVDQAPRRPATKEGAGSPGPWAREGLAAAVDRWPA